MRNLYIDGNFVLLTNDRSGRLIRYDCQKDTPQVAGEWMVPNLKRSSRVASLNNCEMVIIADCDRHAKFPLKLGFLKDGELYFENVEWPFSDHYPNNCVGFNGQFFLATVIRDQFFDILPHSIVAFEPQDRRITDCFYNEIQALRKSDYMPACPTLTQVKDDLILSDSLLRSIMLISNRFASPLHSPGNYSGRIFGPAPRFGVVTLVFRTGLWKLECIGVNGESKFSKLLLSVPWQRLEDIVITPNGHILVWSGHQLFWQNIEQSEWSTLGQ